MARVASARLVVSRVTPAAADATADATRVARPTITVAVARAANLPSSTAARERGVDSTISRRPSSSSADQRFTCVTANAIMRTGSSSNMAPRNIALSVDSPPLMFLRTPRAGDEGALANSSFSLLTICSTT